MFISGSFFFELLTDRLVCGVGGSSIQEKLLAEPSLTYEGAVVIALLMDMANKDAQDL